MIFKTWLSDINKVALAMDGLQNITQFKTGSTIANGMELSTVAVNKYKASIEGLTLSQAKTALSTTALNEAQKQQILTSAGLLESTQAVTLEEVKQMASSATLSAQKKEEILATLQGAYSEGQWNTERLEAIASGEGEAATIAQTILAKKAESAENVKNIAGRKALTASLKEELAARIALMASNPVTWIVGIAAVSAVLIALQEKFSKSLEECTEDLKNYNSEFENAQSSVKSLESELDTCQTRLAELQKLEDNGTLSIVEQEEYERLQKTNDELERNLKIEREKAQLNAIDGAKTADETVNKTVQSNYVRGDVDSYEGVVLHDQLLNVTPKEELEGAIAEYNRLQGEIDKLNKSYDNGSISSEDYTTQLNSLTDAQTKARTRASEMSDILIECEQSYNNLENTGGEFTTTSQQNYDSVKLANQEYSNFLDTINGVNASFDKLDTGEKAQTLKNKYAQKTSQLENGQGSYTVEDKEISDWIDTLSDEDLTVLASINFSGEQTKDSMQEALDYAKTHTDATVDKTDILSFSDVWNSEDFENARKELLSLAEAGQLTPETLQSTEEYKKLLEQTGMSAEEAAKKINSMTDASTQLESMSAQISKMSDMLADKKNGTVASASDLAGFDAEVRGLDSWEEFERVMGSSKSSMEECQAAANALATEWVNSNNFLSNLNDTNKDYYITQLKNMGIENAEAVVTGALTQKERELAAQTEYETLATEYNSDAKNRNNQITTDLANATIAEIAEIIAEGNVTADTTAIMAEFALSKIDVNNAQINTSSDIEQIVAIANAAGASAEYVDALRVALNNLQKAEEGKKEVNDLPLAGISAQMANTSAEINVAAARDDVESALNDIKNQIKENWIDPSDIIELSGSDKYKPSGGSGGSEGKDTKQRIDWIERLLDVLQKKIDRTKAKFENLFTVKSKKNNLTKQIQLTKNLLTATEKAADRYLKAANKVGLSKSLKKKVKNGSYDINDYSSEISEKIQKYENYYDKYKELKQQADELETDIRSLRIDRQQLYVDQAEAKIAKSQALATLQEGNYKKQNKRLEGQKKYLREQYEAQIKIAEAEGNTLEVERLRAELLKELRDNTKEQFDNIANTYDNKIGLTNNKIQAFQDQISLLEAKGQQIGSALYTKQMSLNNANEKKLVAEREKLIAKLEEIPKNTDDWYDAVDTLFAVDGELTQIQIDNANLQKSINQLKFDRFDDLLEKLNDIVDETDFLIDMLDSDNFFDDNGKITDDGITAMGLNAQKYDVYLAEAQKYKEQMAELERDYQNGDVDLETYEAKMREYKNGQQDMIKSANDVKKSLVSLVKEGLDAQNQALEESIQKQKDLLSEQQKARNLNQTLEDQNKRIARLKKQLAVLDADSSESARKTKRELQSELDDLLKEQENTLYDQSIEDQEKSLDELLENSEKQASDYLKNSEVVFVDALNKVNANTEIVSRNIERISKETGVDISANITNAWKQSDNAVSNFGTTIKSTTPGIISQISLITEEMKRLTEESEKAAKSIVNATEGKYTDYTTKGADSKVLADVEWYISKNGATPKKSPSSHSLLNQYIYKKTGKVIAKDKLAGLAKILGVKGVGKDTTADDRSKILKALKVAGFSSGGVIDAKSLIRQTGEDGIALVKHEEAVLTKPEWQSIRDLGIALTNLNQQIYKPYIPEFQTRNAQSPVNTINISTTVEGVATDKIVKDMEGVAKKQAENVITEINRRTYAKGVRWK